MKGRYSGSEYNPNRGKVVTSDAVNSVTITATHEGGQGKDVQQHPLLLLLWSANVASAGTHGTGSGHQLPGKAIITGQ